MESLLLNPWLYLNTPSPGDRSPSRAAALEGAVTKTAKLVLACNDDWAHVHRNAATLSGKRGLVWRGVTLGVRGAPMCSLGGLSTLAVSGPAKAG